MKRILWRLFLMLGALGVVLLGCSNEPKMYERIVIDTYSPNGSFTADTYIDLFDENGDPDDVVDVWTDDDTGDAIAYADGGNPDWSIMARVDYTGGLMSGTYYIRVRGAVETVDDFYAIRVFALDLAGSVPAYDTPGADARPDSLEGDDDPKAGGIPISPRTIVLNNVNGISRSIHDPSVATDDGDVDWFKLVLP